MPLTRAKHARYLALFALLIALLGNVTVYFVGKRADTNLREQRQRGDTQLRLARERADAKLRLSRVNGRLFFCTEIEKLKTAQRQAAIKSYDDLDKNAKLLGIKVTDELRQAAREGRDRTLKRYKAVDCKKLATSGDFTSPQPPTSIEP